MTAEYHKLIKENICPDCKLSMLLFRSTFKKICVCCGKEYKWELNYKQQPLIKHQR
jgi:hypothetical protein